MRMGTLVLSFVVAIGLSLAFGGPVQAQASRTWVSGVGDDANPCSRTAPCKTFAGAISKTAALGEINCLDPGGFGAVTITKSITIDCHEVFASILNAGTNGIIINFDSFADARKTVRIRNLNFNGFNTGLNGIRIISTGTSSANSAVLIEDCVIDGNFGGTARGVSDERVGGGELYIANTTARNTGGTGFAIIPASGSTRIDAIVDNIRGENANFGIQVGNGVKAMINRSVFSGNTGAGIEADTGGEANVDNSVASSNGVGVQAFGTIRISNTDITFNVTGVAGATQSFVNNRVSGNGAAGIPPTPIGVTSNASGQQ